MLGVRDSNCKLLIGPGARCFHQRRTIRRTLGPLRNHIASALGKVRRELSDVVWSCLLHDRMVNAGGLRLPTNDEKLQQANSERQIAHLSQTSPPHLSEPFRYYTDNRGLLASFCKNEVFVTDSTSGLDIMTNNPCALTLGVFGPVDFLAFSRLAFSLRVPQRAPEPLGADSEGNLITLCAGCHARVHGDSAARTGFLT